MTFIQQSLSKDESIETIFSFNWTVWFAVAAWPILGVTAAILAITFLYSIEPQAAKYIALTCIVLSVLFSFYRWLVLRNIEQGVTNKRVLIKRGVIARKTEEMRLSSIETVEINQTITGRLLGAGTVKITGRGVSDLVFVNIDEPMEVKRAIEDVKPSFIY